MFKTFKTTITVFLAAALIIGAFVLTFGFFHAPTSASAHSAIAATTTTHLALEPSEVFQPASFSVKFEGGGFPANDTIDVQTDASFGSHPACTSDGITSLGTVTTDGDGNWAVNVHFDGCFTNRITVSANDDGHVYQTFLDID